VSGPSAGPAGIGLYRPTGDGTSEFLGTTAKILKSHADLVDFLVGLR